MKNLEELNDILYRQIQRLASEDLTEKELDKEIDRAKAMALVSSQLIASSTLQIRREMILSGSHSNIKLLESNNGI